MIYIGLTDTYFCVRWCFITGCYHPWLFAPDYRYPDTDPLTGEVKFRYKPFALYSPDHPSLCIRDDLIKVPCGKCLGCKLDYSRSWADRMIYELDSNDGRGVFCTLTYDNEHVPITFDEGVSDVALGFSLCKRDLQLFFKRLRKHFSGRTIRYYSCGEYGPKTKRPHYHVIIFGIGLDDFSDRRIVGRNELGQDYFSSDEFVSIWQNGFITLSDVSYKTCAYVSRYCAKKIFAPDDLDQPGEKEFVLMSRRPGIGRKYLEMHPDIFDKSHVYLHDQNGSVKLTIPKYFLQTLKLQNPSKYRSIIDDRKRFSLDRDLLKLQGTSLSYIDALELEEEKLMNKTKILFNREEV